MKKLTDFIVNHCYVVLAVMVALAGLSAFISQNVKVNHDIMQYMPDSSETRQGLDVMEDEFAEVTTSNYMIMFENLAEEERSEMKGYFENVNGVKSVDFEDTEEYNREKDGVKYTLYSITVDGEADADNAKNVYNEIHNHLKEAKTEDGAEKYTFFEKGDVASDNGSVLNVLVIVIAIGVAILIITIMSKSYIEPWLYLTAILIAVVINKGTNIIFPNVSHITDSISAILQLALSMDYSIMLANRYRQERAKEENKVEAMKRALNYAFSSISASSVTTIVGLIVLVFMSFTIGRDMGFVLSKGVLLSLVSIFTTLPAFLLFFDKLIIGSKKRAPKLNMTLLGKFANNFRHVALPVFAIILGGSMILKGNVGIEYTGASNNKIGEIFDETNQVAVIYKNDDESKMAEICHDYEDKTSVKQVLCYGNTIGEPEKYNEMKDKAAELGSNLDVEDYLIKTLYYHYFNPNEDNTMTLEELVLFIQNEVENNPNFAGDISASTKTQIERLSNFVVKGKMNSERSLSELASIFEMDENALSKVFVLYGNNERNSNIGQAVTNSKMTLSEFVKFINSKVLTNPEYASEISSEARAKLKQLEPFLNKATINTKTNAAGIAKVLGVSEETVAKVFQYEAYLDYRDENGRTIQEIQAQKEQTKVYIKLQVQATYVAQANATRVSHGFPEMTDAEKTAFLASKDTEINAVVEQKMTEAEEAITNQIAENAANITNSPLEFVNFILEHKNDEMLASSLDNNTLTSLNLAKTVMDAVNGDKKFNYLELSKTFGLDENQLRLLYSLKYVDGNNSLRMSPKSLVDFINGNIINNAKYGSSLSGEQKSKLATVTDLMNVSIAGTPYTSKAVYNLLSPLSNNLNGDLVDMLYMYHGSLYHYDENWTITLEQFVNYLDGNIAKDSRFSSKLSDEKRTKISDAREKIAEAKKMLVGKNYSRAILNTTLDAEGEETFEFIEALKAAINNKKAEVYVIGNSPMALEMSKTFNDEMNLITILTMVSIFIVVAITFKSILIPVILVLIIQAAVWITMSILSLTGSSVYFIALIIVQAILMGATIDYAILYTSYYLEHRKKQKDTSKELYYQNIKSAVIDSYNKSIHTIITSASVLVIVTWIVGNFDKAGSAIAAKICVTVSEGTLCSAILILLILPALLASCDKIILRRKNK
ncbi:MMPL family transporter [Candidatus Saccharibacteria bacterium]|nr:MMPL family transporter [Candidatus Saccharibacteria bacterium]